jgi:hypothetical protein
VNAKQTSTLLGRFVEHQTSFYPLPTSDAQWAIQKPEEAIALSVSAIKNRNTGSKKSAKKRNLSLLKAVLQPPSVSSGILSAKDTFFAAKEKALVKFSYRGDNFTAHFGNATFEVLDTSLEAFILSQPMVDTQIITELGGEGAAETTLGDLWKKLLVQANGQYVELLTNGYANIFYIKDVNGVLRAVDVRWNSVGWGVDVDALDGHRWDGGHQVFSRNS